MTKFGEALREKFRSPREAILALGLDESLLIPSKKDGPMNTTALATRTLSVGAIVAALRPNLKKDAKVSVAMAFDGIRTGKKFDVGKLASRLRTQLKDKLAQDASMGQIAELLDKIDEHERESADESVSKEQHDAMEAAANGSSNLGIPQKVGEEFEKADKGKKFGDKARDWMTEKGMSEDDIGELEAMMEEEEGDDDDEDDDEDNDLHQKGVDEPPPFKGEPTPGGGKDKRAKDKRAKDKGRWTTGGFESGGAFHPIRGSKGYSKSRAGDEGIVSKGAKAKDKKDDDDDEMVSKGAMDAAIAANEKIVTEKILRTQREIHDALKDVRPIVGDLGMTFDSAAAVYKAVLDAKGHKIVEAVPVSVLKRMVGMLPKAGEPSGRHRASDAIAMDAAQTSDLVRRIPGIDTIRVM